MVPGARIKVKDDGRVTLGKLLVEWDPFTTPIMTEVSGTVMFRDIVDGVTIREEFDEITGLRPLSLRNVCLYDGRDADPAELVQREVRIRPRAVVECQGNVGSVNVNRIEGDLQLSWRGRGGWRKRGVAFFNRPGRWDAHRHQRPPRPGRRAAVRARPLAAVLGRDHPGGAPGRRGRGRSAAAVSHAVLLRDRLRRYYTTYYRDVLGIPDWPVLVKLREVEEQQERVALAAREGEVGVAGQPVAAPQVGVATEDNIGYDVAHARHEVVAKLAGRQAEIHAERDRKLEEARKQRQIRRQQAA